MPIRTRFAPSPTGYLHIGGVRTALFNWLLARQSGGAFILRIDDTDQQRNVDAALQPILDGFRWLGLDWDEGPDVGGPHGPYFQSQRSEKYAAAVTRLLAGGAAYRDFATSEEFQAERQTAEREKIPFVYSRRWMAESDAQAAEFERQGRKSVVRLKMPREGCCEFSDLVRGPLSFDWSQETDHVVQRADGSCLYNLASVVDDIDFEITHVVRSIEHLSNTARQIFMFRALGADLPQFAHLPYVAEPGSHNKLSKRKIAQYLKNPDFKRIYDEGVEIARWIGHGTDAESFNPVLVEFYQTVGYLPDAIINYLLLLGWSLDDKTEFFTREQMVQSFTMDRVVKSPASFDPQKLVAFQAHYQNQLALETKVDRGFEYLCRAGLTEPSDAGAHQTAVQVTRAADQRLVVSGDLLNFRDFFVSDNQLEYDDAVFDKRIVQPPDAAILLSDFRKSLIAASEFTAAALEALLHQFIENRQVKINQVIHALRVALTGKGVGFGMFETMEILGRDRCIARIDLALARASEARTRAPR
jgi:glutamyl-tRNA synthetase